jgi:hypothetical protein
MVIFAENFGPLVGLLFLTPIALVIMCRVGVVFLRQMRGQKP